MAPPTEPRLVTDPEALRDACARARQAGQRVGFVPTMGALHEGHLTLMREARARVGDGGLVAVSIFVNPTQFAAGEDLARYPRELDADLARCASAGVDLVFAPTVDAMYPADDATRVHVGGLTEALDGIFRPGHFDGVTTIVARLFALVGPSVAIFGRKDYQQWRVVTRMARDLFLPVEVVGVATVREADGLARSSRNRYLTPEARERAGCVPAALRAAEALWQTGERDPRRLEAVAHAALSPASDTVEYAEVRDAESLGPLTRESASLRPMVLAVAVRIGTTRLIDNHVFGDLPP